MMNLTRQDRQVINNFSLFNKNLEFKKDLKSNSSTNTLIAEYELESDEFKKRLRKRNIKLVKWGQIKEVLYD